MEFDIINIFRANLNCFTADVMRAFRQSLRVPLSLNELNVTVAIKVHCHSRNHFCLTSTEKWYRATQHVHGIIIAYHTGKRSIEISEKIDSLVNF
jgi:hypothetical protein